MQNELSCYESNCKCATTTRKASTPWLATCAIVGLAAAAYFIRRQKSGAADPNIDTLMGSCDKAVQLLDQRIVSFR